MFRSIREEAIGRLAEELRSLLTEDGRRDLRECRLADLEAEVLEASTRLARVEAYHRNFPQAKRKAFLADGHLTNWGLWEREFSDHVPIADLLHALSYV